MTFLAILSEHHQMPEVSESSTLEYSEVCCHRYRHRNQHQRYELAHLSSLKSLPASLFAKFSEHFNIVTFFTCIQVAPVASS